jgi:hypothetical protein
VVEDNFFVASLYAEIIASRANRRFSYQRLILFLFIHKPLPFRKYANIWLCTAILAYSRCKSNLTKFSIKRIRKGDRVFLYRSGVGIVAVGTGSGELKIKNYHNDPSQEDEEYYTPLNGFHKLGKPLQAGEVKLIADAPLNFMGTLSTVNAQEGIRLWEHIHANCI